MKNRYLVPFILLTTLFFLWGFAHNLNPILIPHLKKACQLTDFQSSLIDGSFFIAYFIMAIPAGMVMKKFGYKTGIIAGLLLFAIGAFLFIPAANTRVFAFFLTALFVIASGLTFLETAANPYMTVLGEPEGASQRLNLAQSFNGLAATIAPLLGGLFILSGNTLTSAETASMSAAQMSTFLDGEAATVKMPYLIIGIVVLVVAILLYKSELPEITEAGHDIELPTGSQSIMRHKHLVWGITAQFFYVGAQVCVSSFFIRYLGKTANIDEKTAANFLSAALFCFMIGRFIGTFLMRYISPNILLALYALINVVLLIIVVIYGGMLSVYALIGVEFFMSIMFPTIFSLSIQSLGKETKIGSSLVIMSIVGGAIFPLIMGRLSDMMSIQVAYSVPLVCFFVVFYFGWKGSEVKSPS
ncbi:MULTISPECIES: L-fucose:H+ symporter permease [unclassified Arcicella]|uniref:L-fucose:H+ symporter permease n=1 Tax=unclassified Arcicella TaxID=2644986 RepID=UPI002863BAB9|nr:MULTISPECIES: L-fucose:H+ symporter permease [unclassified Arcicella]MDR6564819.1 FHS family L-fucose permease-like MFS transporter [Arcicella sp. BE51]MDR6814615.1 FHS family L-fucose permease-like MFS transporter [Arcicella sp. BE140]MDR6825993.1 FHS family L-fucose permease-like MFS transporter [Arcicella sp. BE139]